MALNPETLTRHELIGLRTEVVEAANSDLVGIAGRVVSETMNVLVVETDSGLRRVPKRGATFEFRLPTERTDEAAEADKASGTAFELGSETAGVTAGQSEPCEGTAYVTVDGARLLSRPALRTEQFGDTKWR